MTPKAAFAQLPYGCEMVDLRETWKKHIRDNGLKVDDFLTDVVHLNREGGKLMGDILVPAFQYHPEIPPTWHETIKTFAPSEAGPTVLEGDWKRTANGVVGAQGSLKLKFHGNRVDVTSMPSDGGRGTARILIDGKSPSAHPQAYAATLPTRTPIDYRPALKQVILGDDPKVETWTLTAHDISDDGRKFAFDLAGSVTGPDGSGTHEKTFVSSSGRVTLHPRDFSFAEAIRIRKKPLPARFDVTWKVWLMGVDVWSPQRVTEKGKLDRCTLIQGIANAEHTLEIVLSGDGAVPIESVTVHRPPLE